MAPAEEHRRPPHQVNFDQKVRAVDKSGTLRRSRIRRRQTLKDHRALAGGALETGARAPAPYSARSRIVALLIGYAGPRGSSGGPAVRGARER